jgi:urease beta subunit
VIPGEIRVGTGEIELAAGRERRRLTVENRSRRVVRVSSHYPFERVNPRLAFDRESARGFRLDIAAGETARWAPGETREVDLVRYGGRLGGSPAGTGRRGGPDDDAGPEPAAR